MTLETQRTVADWRYTTFGRAGDPAAILARMFEEVAELMGLVNVPISPATVARARDRAATIVDRTTIADEMADVLVLLYGAADEYGVDLQAELDRKMAVNRARRWVTRGDGTGQHGE